MINLIRNHNSGSQEGSFVGRTIVWAMARILRLSLLLVLVAGVALFMVNRQRGNGDEPTKGSGSFDTWPEVPSKEEAPVS